MSEGSRSGAELDCIDDVEELAMEFRSNLMAILQRDKETVVRVDYDIQEIGRRERR